MKIAQRGRGFQTVFFGLTILVSAFLLFQVQPMIGKFILPWFGGGPSVWTASMLFFQTLLLGGYAYAHYLSRLPAAKQVRLHLLVLAGALLWLIFAGLTQQTPITPGAQWKPQGGIFPVWQVLGVLLASVGVPYFLLSTTSSLVQAWFSQVQRERSPYAYYALSNAASLVALLSYPLLFEPAWTLRQQGWFWSAGFGLYLLLMAGSALIVRRALARQQVAHSQLVLAGSETVEPARMGSPAREDISGQAVSASASTPSVLPDWLPWEDVPPAKGWRARQLLQTRLRKLTQILPASTWMRLYWVLLAMTASVMLLATTNHMTQDVASVPFLWVLPLSLYLLTFVIAFAERLERLRWIYLPLALGALFLGYTALDEGSRLSLQMLILYDAAVVFAVALLCHSELYARRPPPSQLTGFYLMMSVGGALGGVFVNLVAPLIFPDYWEYPLGLGVSALLVVAIAATLPGRRLVVLRGLAALAALALAGLLVSIPLYWINSTSLMSRNFYGVVRVRPALVDGMPGYSLIHGGILHGMQVSQEPYRYRPTKYYSYSTGIGVAFVNHPRRAAGEALRVGAVGLGIGTVASYGRPGDVFRFYEIDPQVMQIAQDTRYFTYLADSAAEIELVLGDARLSMERELAEGRPQQYDLLIVDAFSGDSIPTHLINREAVALYLQHLAPSGMVAFHISNRHINLEPVTAGLAQEFGLHSKLMVGGGADWQGTSSTWVLLAPDASTLSGFGFSATGRTLEPDPAMRLWTDDYSNLFQVLR